MVFVCYCRSRAEVDTRHASELFANAYRQLMASCPVFVPPGPRGRVWENAE